jgi:CBS domain containing-hemolysin-like protein
MNGEHSLDFAGVAWRLGATLFFVLLNGFFVAAEFALVKVRRSRIATLASAGSRPAKTADHILNHLDLYLSACQLGITLASLILGALGEPAVARLIFAGGTAMGFQLDPHDPVLHWVSLLIAFAVITILHMTVGEQAPKMWALQRAERMTLQTSIPLRMFALTFRPFIWVVNAISNWMLRSGGLKVGAGHESSATTEEIRHMLSRSAEAGEISPREGELAENVFKMIDLEVRHILMPRVDVDYLSLQNDLEANLRLLRRSGHSRFPLCEVGLDTVVGFVHVKDIFAGGEPQSLEELRARARPPVFAPETQPVSVLILELQRQHSHCAVVLDEHGSASGLVFLEDALEEIVGPIADEFDVPRKDIEEVAPGCYELSGMVALPEAETRLGIELEEGDEDTIGGHVVARLGRIARPGDTVDVEGHRIAVLEVTRRRISRLRIEPIEEEPQDGESEDASEATPLPGNQTEPTPSDS